jgi:hypothetical protein
MKKLYIIGNGFDLHHGLRTHYYDFAQYLERSNNELFILLEKYISFPVNHNSLWKDFESNLANLDIDEILSDNSIYLPDIANDNFRERDLHVLPDMMEDFFQKLTEGLFESFLDFIQLVEYPGSASSKMIQLDINETFLTFNYTNTLERLYGVQKGKVTYIHNSAFYGLEPIILGHGINPNNFEDTLPEPPDDLAPEDYSTWYNEIESWDYSFDTGRETLQQFFNKTFKSTEKVIKQKQKFFEVIKQYDEINIFGHSLSDIDMPYFKEIYNQSRKDTIWKVSYYCLIEKKQHFIKLMELGVQPDKLELLELKDIQKNNRQLCLEL